MTEDVLSRIDHYLDRVPRAAARTEEIGPFTLFVGQPHGWQYYGRPRFALDEAITRRDVERLLERQRELEVPETIEGLADLTPSLAAACQDAGLRVQDLPLLIYRSPRKVPIPDGVRIRRAEPNDVAVPSSQVVAALAFEYEGTDAADVGPKERDELLTTRDEGTDALVRDRIASGLSVLFVAEDESGVVASGMHQPVDDVTEIVGVATLPVMRRRGLAGALTADLVSDSQRRGVSLCFLTAGSTEIARVYERVGFERVGTAIAASPAVP
jgi:N-acetylglutamate synthase-like GNAT family acetyltransferase